MDREAVIRSQCRLPQVPGAHGDAPPQKVALAHVLHDRSGGSCCQSGAAALKSGEQKGVWSPRRPPAVNDRLMGSMRATKSPQTPGFKVLPITKNKTSGPREA